MDDMILVRGISATLTVVAAVLVAANWSARLTVIGFAVFIVASIGWIVDGWFEAKSSLVIQNAILLVVNIAGVFRWKPKIQVAS